MTEHNIINKIQNLLNSTKTEKGKTDSTHFSLGGQLFNGKFTIVEKNDKSKLKKYLLQAYNNNIYLSIAEKPKEYGPLKIDLDFKKNITEINKDERLYNYDMIIKMVDYFKEALYNFCEPIKEELDAYIFEKKNTYIKNEELKDGVHIIYPNICLHKNVLNEINNYVIEKCKNDELFNHFNETVVDNAIISNPWLMYGCCKPGKEPYKFSYILDSENNKIEQQENPEELIKLLSIQSSKYKKSNSTKLKEDIIIEDIKPKNKNHFYNETQTQTQNITTEDEDKEYADIIDIKYIDDYKIWLKLVWACANENEYSLALYLSQKSKKFEIEYFNKIYNDTDKDKGITKGTFYYFAKLSDETKFYEIKRKYNKNIYNKTDKGIADVFIDMFDDYILYDGMNYFYNGVYWQEDNSKNKLKRAITNDLLLIYNSELIKVSKLANKEEDEINKTILLKKQTVLGEIILKLQTSKHVKSILDMVNMLIEKDIDDIKFENKPYLFTFKNCIYDLKNNTFIKPNKEDYLCLNTGYEYREPTQKEILELNDKLNEIFPINDEKKTYLTLLSTGLLGETLEKFILANGSGGNGKGVLNELTYELLGNYGYNCSNSVLLNPLKFGSNPEVANMKYKRTIFYREPDESQSKLNIATIKELTGGKEVNARLNHSNNTKTQLSGTHILECNKKPEIGGKIDDSVIRRIIDVPFRSTFTNNSNSYFGDYIFKADSFYKTDEFKQKYKFALFKILCDHLKEYFENNKNIDLFISSSINKRTMDYLESNDEIKEWFNENYEKTNDKLDIIQIKDIYDDFKVSELFNNFSKKEKRTFNKKKFNEEISTNIHFRKHYKERLRSKEIQEKYNVTEFRNVLIGFIKINKDDDDEEEYN